MGKVRTKKEHKKRVAKRNNILQQDRKKVEKAQKEFLMQLIREEKEKGLFDNKPEEFKLPEPSIPSMGLPITDVSSFGIEGPKI